MLQVEYLQVYNEKNLSYESKVYHEINEVYVIDVNENSFHRIIKVCIFFSKVILVYILIIIIIVYWSCNPRNFSQKLSYSYWTY